LTHWLIILIINSLDYYLMDGLWWPNIIMSLLILLITTLVILLTNTLSLSYSSDITLISLFMIHIDYITYSFTHDDSRSLTNTHKSDVYSINLIWLHSIFTINSFNKSQFMSISSIWLIVYPTYFTFIFILFIII